MHNSNAYVNKFYCLCLSHIQKNMNRKSFHENCCTDADIHDGSTYTHHDLKSKSEKNIGDFFIALNEGNPTFPFTTFSDHKDIEWAHNHWHKLVGGRLEIHLHHLLSQTNRAVRIDCASTAITNKKESDP